MNRAGATIRRRSRRGFALIEVVCALLIFSVAVVALIRALGESTSFQSDLSMRQRASMLAQNILEEMRYTGDITQGEQSGEFQGADAAFRWETAVEETDTDLLMAITVKVSWGQGGGERSYELSTEMMEPPES